MNKKELRAHFTELTLPRQLELIKEAIKNKGVVINNQFIDVSGMTLYNWKKSQQKDKKTRKVIPSVFKKHEKYDDINNWFIKTIFDCISNGFSVSGTAKLISYKLEEKWGIHWSDVAARLFINRHCVDTVAKAQLAYETGRGRNAQKCIRSSTSRPTRDEFTWEVDVTAIDAAAVQDGKPQFGRLVAIICGRSQRIVYWLAIPHRNITAAFVSYAIMQVFVKFGVRKIVSDRGSEIYNKEIMRGLARFACLLNDKIMPEDGLSREDYAQIAEECNLLSLISKPNNKWIEQVFSGISAYSRQLPGHQPADRTKAVYDKNSKLIASSFDEIQIWINQIVIQYNTFPIMHALPPLETRKDRFEYYRREEQVISVSHDAVSVAFSSAGPKTNKFGVVAIGRKVEPSTTPRGETLSPGTLYYRHPNNEFGFYETLVPTFYPFLTYKEKFIFIIVNNVPIKVRPNQNKNIMHVRGERDELVLLDEEYEVNTHDSCVIDINTEFVTESAYDPDHKVQNAMDSFAEDNLTDYLNMFEDDKDEDEDKEND